MLIDFLAALKQKNILGIQQRVIPNVIAHCREQTLSVSGPGQGRVTPAKAIHLVLFVVLRIEPRGLYMPDTWWTTDTASP